MKKVIHAVLLTHYFTSKCILLNEIRKIFLMGIQHSLIIWKGYTENFSREFRQGLLCVTRTLMGCSLNCPSSNCVFSRAVQCKNVLLSLSPLVEHILGVHFVWRVHQTTMDSPTFKPWHPPCYTLWWKME